MSKQAWKIGITPRQRWELALATFHKDYSVKGNKSRRALANFRAAFGLTDICIELAERSKVSRTKCNDTTTVHVVEVTRDNLDTLFEIVDGCTMTGAFFAVVGPFLDTLEGLRDGRLEGVSVPDDAQPLTDHTEPPGSWRHSSLDEEIADVSVFRAALEECATYESFRRAICGKG